MLSSASVSPFAATVLGFLVQVQNLTMAAVVSAFFALAFRSCALPFVERGRAGAVTLLRFFAGAAFLVLGSLYALFTSQMLVWDARAAGVAVAVAGLALGPLAFRYVMGARRGRDARGRALRQATRGPGPVAFLAQLCALLALLLLAAVTLMRAGFLALTQDRVVLLVDVTGETGAETVRWAPPDQPMREERLITHRVVFRTPDGSRVAETWVYGDEVAIKGRVLRLSPLLNAAGVPNLFELLFAHNGYRSAERHASYPHVALPLPPLGPLAVHHWWRPLQARLLERWEQGTAAESPWAVRSATTESTYYPLADADGNPVQQTYRLVLTPGGLSAS